MKSSNPFFENGYQIALPLLQYNAQLEMWKGSINPILLKKHCLSKNVFVELFYFWKLSIFAGRKTALLEIW